MEDWVNIITNLGFPMAVAMFVLVRLEPAIKRLEQSITSLMLITAKSNGMKQATVDEIIEKVMNRKGLKRRTTDAIEEDDKESCT